MKEPDEKYPKARAGEILNFSNTEIAFRHLSDSSLTRAYFLFTSISQQFIVDFGSKILVTAIRLRLPITRIIKWTMFDHFCGGESIEECQNLADNLAKFNIGTIGDYSVEGKGDEESFDFAFSEICRTVEFASRNLSPAFAVFKMTAIGNQTLLTKIQSHTLTPDSPLSLEHLNGDEREAFKRVQVRFRNLCSLAKSRNVRLMVDAEDYSFQSTIDRMTEDMMKEFNKDSAVVFQTVQMYRKDRLAYVNKLLDQTRKFKFTAGIKVVRGAYMEKERLRSEQQGYPDPIQSSKKNTDRDFDACLQLCIANIERVWLFCGTHNEKSTFHLTKLMAQAHIEHDDPKVVFSQLHGMSENLSYNLAHHGYTVRKYVPYGPVKEVMPYLIRRAEENSSIQGQTGRELALLREERKRRKLIAQMR